MTVVMSGSVKKLCKVYRAQTKGKVERFNLYLKRNFYIPLKSALKGSNIHIDTNLLNTKVFAWLEMANNRIHYTTKQKPTEQFKQEQGLLNLFIQVLKKLKRRIFPIIK